MTIQSRTTRRSFLKRTALGAGALALGGRVTAVAKSAAKPNIVLILADDLGYGDLGCYGATKVKTPNIDRLAREGILFTDAHSPVSVCTPTRYGLLTGSYYWRVKKRWNRDELLIEPEQTTVASLLKSAGYATGCVGKWHLGFGVGPLDWNGELKPGPLELGFDYYFGTPMSHNEPPHVYVENHHVVGLDKNDPITVTEPGEGAYWGIQKGGEKARYKEEELATTQTAKALTFIEKNKDKPLFLYFATNNVHVPLTPDSRFMGTSQAGVYGDYIHELDWVVGEVMGALERLGKADDTLFILSSDNGAMLFRDVIEAGHKANGGLLGQKTDVWEGGHRVPFLARWPGRIKAGAKQDALVCLTDMLATFAAITRQELDEDAGPDSFNALPALLEERLDKPVRDSLVLHGTDGFAIRQGPWLLIPKQGSGGFSTQDQRAWRHFADVPHWNNSDYTAEGKLRDGAPAGQLYNLAEDPSETTNLYEKHPEIVERLTELMAQIRNSARSR